MTSGEDRTATFFLTAISVGCLTEAVTRFISLMRIVPSVIICLIVGIIALFLLLFQMGLAEG